MTEFSVVFGEEVGSRVVSGIVVVCLSKLMISWLEVNFVFENSNSNHKT